MSQLRVITHADWGDIFKVCMYACHVCTSVRAYPFIESLSSTRLSLVFPVPFFICVSVCAILSSTNIMSLHNTQLMRLVNLADLVHSVWDSSGSGIVAVSMHPCVCHCLTLFCLYFTSSSSYYPLSLATNNTVSVCSAGRFIPERWLNLPGMDVLYSNATPGVKPQLCTPGEAN